MGFYRNLRNLARASVAQADYRSVSRQAILGVYVCVVYRFFLILNRERADRFVCR